MDETLELVDVEEVVELVEVTHEVLELVEQGPQGVPGPVADIEVILEQVDVAVQDYFVLHPQSFVYDQATEVFRVDILHPLDHRPVVVATDSAGEVWRGRVSYPAANRVVVEFNVPFAGRFTLT